MTRVKSAAMCLLLALCAGWYVHENLLEQLPGITGTPSDFTHYYEAAKHVAAGKTPYSDASYDYPPAVAFALTPLALTDYVTARRIWFALSHVFLLLAAWLTWRLSGGGLGAACVVALVWALGGAAAENLGLGQLGPLLVLLIAVAYSSAGVRQGVVVGAGMALKFVPGLLIVPAWLRGDRASWSAIFAMAMLGVLLPSAIIGVWSPHQTAPIRADYWMGTPALLNWSMPAVVLRVLDPPIRGARLPHDWEFGNAPESTHLPPGRRAVSVAVAALLVLGGIGALWAACRGRLDATQVLWASAALISLGVAASPISWTHYQLLQYPGLALLLYRALRRRAWWSAGGVVIIGAMLYPVPVAVLRAYYQQYGGWTAWSPATLYVWTSITPLAALLLFALLLCQLRPTPVR